MSKPLFAEALGVFVLVFAAVGSAVFGAQALGAVGVALAFGLVLTALVHVLGPASGCHVNPAVTLGLLLSRRISASEASGYVLAQLTGAVLAAALLWFTVSVGGVRDQTGVLGANGYGEHVNAVGAFTVETVLTFLLVITVLSVADSRFAHLRGPVVGLAFTAVYLASVPLTGGAANPARSLGPALFAGGEPLAQLWLFLVAPLVGGVLAALVWPLVRRTRAAAPAGAGGAR